MPFMETIMGFSVSVCIFFGLLAHSEGDVVSIVPGHLSFPSSRSQAPISTTGWLRHLLNCWCSPRECTNYFITQKSMLSEDIYRFFTCSWICLMECLGLSWRACLKHRIGDKESVQPYSVNVLYIQMCSDF